MLIKAVKKLRDGKKNKSIMKLLKKSNDGPLIAIVVEDFAATLGLIIALIGTLISYFTNNPIYDAISSILIGILLMVSGLFLGYEMKHLITGEAISSDLHIELKNALQKNKEIISVITIKTISIGAEKYLCIVELNYQDNLEDVDIVSLNKKLETELKSIDQRLEQIYLIPA